MSVLRKNQPVSADLAAVNHPGSNRDASRRTGAESRRLTRGALGAAAMMVIMLPASAFADLYVSPNGQDFMTVIVPIFNDCRSEGAPCATVQWALTQASADDTIRVLDGPITECDIVVNKDVTIESAGADPVVFDAGFSCRHFDIDADVLLRKVELINGNDTTGGAINVRSGATLTLAKSRIANSAATAGGAIANSGTLIVRNQTVIEGNTAVTGGAIRSVGPSVSIRNSTLALNDATSDGGAIHISGGTLDIDDATFSGNTAATLGGAVRASNTGITVDHSTFFGNSAGFGGGFCLFEGSLLELTDSTLSFNSAGTSGGGIFNDRAEVIIHASTLAVNSAVLSGGGFFNLTGGLLTAWDTTWISNSSASGGGLLDMAMTTTALERNTFERNSASGDGGAIHYTGDGSGGLNVTNSTFSENEARRGAAVFDTGAGDTRMANTTLYGQVTDPQGGALFTDSTNGLGISNSIITATTDAAGAIGADCIVLGSIFGQHNRSDNCGFGGIFNLGPVTGLDPVLKRNRGLTDTHALEKESNAIDSGFNSCPHPATGIPLADDQRLVPRPQADVCDIGAYEYLVLVAEPNPNLP